MQHRFFLGMIALATLFAGCYVDHGYDRRYGHGYDSGHYDDRGHYEDHGSYDDDRHGRHDRDHDSPTIVCASKDGRAARCRTDFRIESAEIDKRYSGSPCDYGRSWGFDHDEVWVDRGCRARFRLYPSRGWR
jgi:Protein of unknown function (DUF3011)